GIDFAHPDFMDDQGKSRIVAIWDQGGDAFDPPNLTVTGAKSGRSTGYGSEIRKEDIEQALGEAPKAKLSPHDLAPQSQRSRGSHGTHVASIAAGRSGVCKRARIAAVMIALPDADLDRRSSFYDTTRIVDGIEYLFAVAERENIPSVAINISLGTNGGPHDASDLMSRWIDRSMAEPGRAICVAAGNSGQEAPQFEGDLGFWSGRVHASGKIAAAALRKDLEWVVVGNGFEDISENELEIWYSAADEFAVELITPGGERIGPVSPGEQIENLMLADRTMVSIYNVLSDARNGDNRISLYLSPFMGDPIIGITAGNWKVRLVGKVIRNGNFNAWIERDDPHPGQTGGQWRLPSFFGPGSFVDHSTLSSLACGPRIVGVANFDEARELLNASSSQGPTRDGRMKPEIAAPGTEIVAACGFAPDTQWIEMSGTSMASPYVTGVAALMLSLNPRLTAAQIGGIIRRTSNPMPGSTYEWQDGAGFGVIDPSACLREAVRITEPVRDISKRRRP
ncbi:MAG: S8 family serine peptidase, partial [Allosphingosinicella sp.]